MSYYDHSTYIARRNTTLRCAALMLVGVVLGLLYGLWAPWPWSLTDAVWGAVFGFGLGRLFASRKIWRRQDAERDEWDRRLLGDGPDDPFPSGDLT